MGRPSDKKRSARRPGKRERARVKSGWKSSTSTHVPGVGSVSLTAGRKHLNRFIRWTDNIAALRAGADSSSCG
jgi:hypothetical protein